MFCMNSLTFALLYLYQANQCVCACVCVVFFYAISHMPKNVISSVICDNMFGIQILPFKYLVAHFSV